MKGSWDKIYPLKATPQVTHFLQPSTFNMNSSVMNIVEVGTVLLQLLLTAPPGLDQV